MSRGGRLFSPKSLGRRRWRRGAVPLLFFLRTAPPAMVDDTLCSVEQFDTTLRKVDTEKCKLRDDSVGSGILSARPGGADRKKKSRGAAPRRKRLLPSDLGEKRRPRLDGGIVAVKICHPVRYHLCLLLVVRVAGYIANLLDFYSYRIIGKLTAFLQSQEFSQRKLPVACSTFVARLSLRG
jgi:hypothetical protein